MLAADYDALAAQVAADGVRVVTGNLVADDTRYDRTRLGPDWTWDDEPYYYAAQVSALTVAPDTDYDAGTVIVHAAPADRAGAPPVVTTTPATGYVRIDNRAETVSRRRDRDLDRARARQQHRRGDRSDRRRRRARQRLGDRLGTHRLRRRRVPGGAAPTRRPGARPDRARSAHPGDGPPGGPARLDDPGRTDGAVPQALQQRARRGADQGDRPGALRLGHLDGRAHRDQRVRRRHRNGHRARCASATARGCPGATSSRPTEFVDLLRAVRAEPWFDDLVRGAADRRPTRAVRRRHPAQPDGRHAGGGQRARQDRQPDRCLRPLRLRHRRRRAAAGVLHPAEQLPDLVGEGAGGPDRHGAGRLTARDVRRRRGWHAPAVPETPRTPEGVECSWVKPITC